MFSSPCAVEEFARLQREFGFSTCFETGTYQGVGTLGASQYCPIVATVEITSDDRDRAFKRWQENGFSPYSPAFEGFKNRCFYNVATSRTIISMLGSSPEAMRWYLERSDFDDPKNPHMFCFYLDAHWHDYWPILDELKVIADFKLSKSVIVVHDFKVPQEAVPGNGLGYDSYKGQDLDLAYVKPSLDAINPAYKLHYNTEGPRGILYATP